MKSHHYFFASALTFFLAAIALEIASTIIYPDYSDGAEKKYNDAKTADGLHRWALIAAVLSITLAVRGHASPLIDGDVVGTRFAM